jgi:hypothetical protein
LLQVTVPPWPLKVPVNVVVLLRLKVAEPDAARPEPMLVIVRDVALEEFHDTVTLSPALIELRLTLMSQLGCG